MGCLTPWHSYSASHINTSRAPLPDDRGSSFWHFFRCFCSTPVRTAKGQPSTAPAIHQFFFAENRFVRSKGLSFFSKKTVNTKGFAQKETRKKAVTPSKKTFSHPQKKAFEDNILKSYSKQHKPSLHKKIPPTPPKKKKHKQKKNIFHQSGI